MPALDVADLVWLARCERRLWLDQHAPPEPPAGPTADARARLGLRSAHRARVLAASPTATIIPPDAEAVAATRAALRRGDALIAGAAFAVERGGLTITGTADLLRRDARPSASYTPISVVLHGRPMRWDRLLLDALRWLVGEAGGQVPPGELWLGTTGDGPGRVSVQSGPLPAFDDLLRRVGGLADGPPPPIWFDSDHCPFCRWRASCDAAAIDQGDIALLPGLRRDQARLLRARGVHRLAQVVSLPPRDLAQLPDATRATATLLQQQAAAIASGRPIAAPPQAPPPAGLFIDIETDPLTHAPWAFGWLAPGGAAGMAIVGPAGPQSAGLELHFVAGAAQGWDALARMAAGVAGRVVHWGEAEQLILAQSGGAGARATLAERLLDAQQVVGGRLVLPVPRLSDQRGGGLKAVARWLGYRWPAGADHWTIGWEAYRSWLAGGDPAALAPAIAYLHADLRALAVVWQRLVAAPDIGQSSNIEPVT